MKAPGVLAVPATTLRGMRGKYEGIAEGYWGHLPYPPPVYDSRDTYEGPRGIGGLAQYYFGYESENTNVVSRGLAVPPISNGY